MRQLAWPMAEWQIEHRKSSLVLSARFPVVKWRSRSSDCNTTQANWNCKLCLLNKLVLLSDYPIRICGCQRPRRWTRRSYCSRRSLPSLFNPLSFFPSSFFSFLPSPSPLTPATQATTTYYNSCRQIKRLKAFLPPRVLRPEGEIRKGHSSNSRVYWGKYLQLKHTVSMPEKISICLNRGCEESVGNDDVSIVWARKYEIVRMT